MTTFFQIIQAVSGLLMIILVLLHSPKGDGLASIGGASQLFSGQKGVEAGLNKITASTAFIFIYSSLVLGYSLTTLPKIIGSFIVFGGIIFTVSVLKKFFIKEN